MKTIEKSNTPEEKMFSLINKSEELLYKIQERSSVLCSKKLHFNDYSSNPTRDLLKNSGEALVLLGKLRTLLENIDIIDKIEEILLNIQNSAGFAASIKSTQINVIGIGLITDSACILALLGRLRLEQKYFIEEQEAKKQKPQPEEPQPQPEEPKQEPEEPKKEPEEPQPQPEEPKQEPEEPLKEDDEEIVIKIDEDEDENENVLQVNPPNNLTNQ